MALLAELIGARFHADFVAVAATTSTSASGDPPSIHVLVAVIGVIGAMFGGVGTAVLKSALDYFKRRAISKAKAKRDATQRLESKKRADAEKSQLESKIAAAKKRRYGKLSPRVRSRITATRLEAAGSSNRVVSVNAPNRGTGAQIIVVASGKGGVGKSILSLALLEYYSREGNTLLVDFDMHNRGLTSLLRNDGTTTVLAEMKRFDDLYIKTTIEEESDPQKESRAYRELRSQFTEDPKNPDGFKGIECYQFDGKPLSPVDASEADLRVNPRNAYFLPSILPPEMFLDSDVSQASFKEVFYFLRAFAFWVALPRESGSSDTNAPIETIILDCHGAHDLFMVGAIHAASKLLVVTTPEPGSFDGTLDLVNFSRQLQTTVPEGRFPSVLAINMCTELEKEKIGVLKEYYETPDPLPVDGVVTIALESSVRDIGRQYQFGDACSNSVLWPCIARIANCFRDFKPSPLPVNSPESESNVRVEAEGKEEHSTAAAPSSENVKEAPPSANDTATPDSRPRRRPLSGD